MGVSGAKRFILITYAYLLCALRNSGFSPNPVAAVSYCWLNSYALTAWGAVMRFWSTALFVFILLLITVPAHAEKRVALVIGNSAYKNAATLQNPRNDAQDVEEALKRLSFETIVGLDLDDAGMKEKSIAFARAARNADVAFFYYSGHAMQFNGFNYLMPVDAVLHDEADLRRLTRVDDIVSDLTQAKNLRILVLDACRDNPLAEELNRSLQGNRAFSTDRGLARIIPPSGMIISYATQAGRTAADGRGRNSPYTTAFLKSIEATQEIGAVFRHITADVYTSTQGRQLPELSLSLIGDFYLKGPPELLATTPDNPRIPTTIPAVQTKDEAARVWTVMQNTTSTAVLEDFIRQFGATSYGSLARARLDEMKKQASEAEEAARAKEAAETKAAEAARIKGEQEAKAAEAASRHQNLATLTPSEQTTMSSVLSPDEIARQLQIELRRVGCFTSDIDGEWKANSEHALELFNKQTGMKLDTKGPSHYALDAVSGKSSRVCPLICQPGFHADGERCVQTICKVGFTVGCRGTCVRVPERPNPAVRPEPKRVDETKKEKPLPANDKVTICDKTGCREAPVGCKPEAGAANAASGVAVICR
jgi:hypothetical protein